MVDSIGDKFVSTIFITFSGNCRKALTFYQTCFGGTLKFETFEKKLPAYTEKPVVIGSLISNRIIIHGSDLVHNEGRTLGNYMSIFVYCKNPEDRQVLKKKLEHRKSNLSSRDDEGQKLVEITDAFDVRWVLGV